MTNQKDTSSIKLKHRRQRKKQKNITCIRFPRASWCAPCGDEHIGLILWILRIVRAGKWTIRMLGCWRELVFSWTPILLVLNNKQIDNKPDILPPWRDPRCQDRSVQIRFPFCPKNGRTKSKFLIAKLERLFSYFFWKGLFQLEQKISLRQRVGPDTWADIKNYELRFCHCFVLVHKKLKITQRQMMQ